MSQIAQAPPEAVRDFIRHHLQGQAGLALLSVYAGVNFLLWRILRLGLWSKQHPPGNRKAPFDWRTSAHYLRLPILRKLFYEAAEPGQLDALNLSEVLDWAGAALNRVDWASFFAAILLLEPELYANYQTVK